MHTCEWFNQGGGSCSLLTLSLIQNTQALSSALPPSAKGTVIAVNVVKVILILIRREELDAEIIGLTTVVTVF